MKVVQVIPCACLVLSLINIAASADVRYLSQSRSVSAGGDSTSAPDFALFIATAYDSRTYPWAPAGTCYWMQASQNSTLGTCGIVAGGGASEGGPFDCYGSTANSALSEFRVVFAIDAPGEFLLTGDLFARGDYGGTNKGPHDASVELSNAAGTIFSSMQYGWPQPGDTIDTWPQRHIEEILALDSGTYALDVRALAECYYTTDDPWPGCGGGGYATYEIRLMPIPAPAVGPLTLCGLGVVAFLRKRILR